MATIVFSAIGTAIGGPVGGVLGALIGNQVDQAVIGSGSREGPRLKELALTTSSYGTPLARHYGRVRAAGSIIWATDLAESSEESGGGKGRPSTTSYSYSSSFAVALASRPIEGVGRIWADGNLLRGAARDLKVGGELRIYRGFGDQQADPLIAAAQGEDCPGFRGLAYCVFEGLQLADFGNRIPALTFEVVASDGEVTLAQMLPTALGPSAIERPLTGLKGFSEDGGSSAATLSAIGQVYPMALDAGADALSIRSADSVPADVPLLPEPVLDPAAEGMGSTSGRTSRRQTGSFEIPQGLRYYDTARDYQPGLQRAEGRLPPGPVRILEFAGSLDAGDARKLANAAAERARWAGETLSWRIAELDPEFGPGKVVNVPGKAGNWRIESWEWRDSGVELELRRLPSGPARTSTADAGEVLSPPDLLATPTVLAAFELPWDGLGSSEERRIYAAPSSVSAGWTGAALYAEVDGALVPLGASGSRRNVMGETATALGAGSPHLLDRGASIDVVLASEDFELLDATPGDLANGANRAVLGAEIMQFARATRLAGSQWRIETLLRGRGGTEWAAQSEHPSGTPFVLLNGSPTSLDPARLGDARKVAAIGLADPDPVIAPIVGLGRTLRPLSPVHPQAMKNADGSLTLCWTRRARGAWGWLDGIEVPLNEQAESYLVGVGDTQAPALHWEVSQARLDLSAATLSTLTSEHSGAAIWVRQIGSRSSSLPLLLYLIP